MATNGQVYVSSITLWTDDPVIQSRVEALNQAISETCQATGCTLIDNDPSFKLADGDINSGFLQADGASLNQAGMEKLIKNLHLQGLVKVGGIKNGWNKASYVNEKTHMTTSTGRAPCWNCGDPSHTSNICRQRRRLTCYKCREVGHKSTFYVNKGLGHGHDFTSITIGYNNAQGLGIAKQSLMKNLLVKHSIDIVAIVESKRDLDHQVTEIADNHIWIGKNRADESKGGGVGFFLRSDTTSVLEDNLLGSKEDEYERLWLRVKTGQCDMAIGVVYFPNDNVSDKADVAKELQQELIENVATLKSSFENILLVGDFNGKTKSCRPTDTKSSNGELLDTLVVVTSMVNLNTSEKCNGKFTWRQGDRTSVIDYALCSEGLFKDIDSMVVDEDQEVSIGSDHIFLILKRNKEKCRKMEY